MGLTSHHILTYLSFGLHIALLPPQPIFQFFQYAVTVPLRSDHLHTTLSMVEKIKSEQVFLCAASLSVSLVAGIKADASSRPDVWQCVQDHAFTRTHEVRKRLPGCHHSKCVQLLDQAPKRTDTATCIGSLSIQRPCCSIGIAKSQSLLWE